PMDQAVADRQVVPLLYERRHVEQEVLDGPTDTWFERICQGLSDEQQKDLKRKFSRAEMLTRAEQRLRVVAFAASCRYRANWQSDDHYYQAQLVAPDKKSAIRIHEYLEEIGHVSSAVLISAPEEREGYEELDDRTEDRVLNFWQRMMQEFGNEEQYNK